MVMGFPRKSIAEVLKLPGVKPRELDHVAVASEWGHFLNDYVDFSNGVFGVDQGVVRNLFFSAGFAAELSAQQGPHLGGGSTMTCASRPLRAAAAESPKSWRDEFDITCPVEFRSHHFARRREDRYHDALNGTRIQVPMVGIT